MKAYGNYLGIAQLGAFMAHEMKLEMSRMNVIVGIAKFERISKSDQDLAPLVAASRSCLAQPTAATSAKSSQSLAEMAT